MSNEKKNNHIVHEWNCTDGICALSGGQFKLQEQHDAKHCFHFDLDFWCWKSARNCWDECFLPYWQETDEHKRKHCHCSQHTGNSQQFYLYDCTKNNNPFSDARTMMMFDYITSILETFYSYSPQTIEGLRNKRETTLKWLCALSTRTWLHRWNCSADCDIEFGDFDSFLLVNIATNLGQAKTKKKKKNQLLTVRQCAIYRRRPFQLASSSPLS